MKALFMSIFMQLAACNSISIVYHVKEDKNENENEKKISGINS
jgi:hypothetical protein